MEMAEKSAKEQHKYHKRRVCVLQKIREAIMGEVCEQFSRTWSYRRSFAQIMNPISMTRMVMIMAVMKRC